LCSFELTFISLNFVKFMGWFGGICFVLCMITCWSILMITFPGWNDTKLIVWNLKTYYPITDWGNIIWAVFNILSTLLTIVGIYKIFKTLQLLKRYNPCLKTNYFQLTLHAFILTLNLIPVMIVCLPSAWLTPHQWAIFNIILIGTDTMS
jgi:hypothetical protein